MDINKFKEEKLNMECKIHRFLNDYMEEFYKKTGESPSNISVNLVSIQTMSQEKGKSIVESVTIDVKI